MKKFISMFLVGIISVVGIAGCGGGGGGGGGGAVDTTAAAGVWMGSVTESGGTTFDTVGLLSTNGKLQFVVEDPTFACDGTQYSGTFSMDGNVGSGNITGYAAAGCMFSDGSTVSSGTIDFTIAGNALTGTYSSPGDSGSFAFTYDAIAENALALSDIQGNWGYNLSPTMYSHLAIEANGSFTGYDDSGCDFTGQTSVINPDWAILNISMTTSNCTDPTINGTYTGLGLLQFDAAGDNLVFLVSNPTLAGFDILDRKPSFTTINPIATVNETLDINDNFAPDRSFIDSYTFTLPVARTITIRLDSADFDAYLVLFQGSVANISDVNAWQPYWITSDDDSGGGLNSFISINLPAGNYVVVANSISAGSTGNYTLTLL